MGEHGKDDIGRIRRRLSELDGGLAGLSERADVEALDTVRALVEIYGEALARVVTIATETAPGLHDALGRDELVGHLLLVHDLHPHDPATRIRRALEELGPRLAAELTGYDDGVATVSVEGAVRAGGDAEETVKATVAAAAPEVRDVRVRVRTEPAFVPLTAVRSR